MLPSASLHQKYVYFVSLGFVSLKGNGLRFPQPQDSKKHICFVPLSLTTGNILILPSANLHQKYAGFFSLSLQVRLKVYGLCFPQPHVSKIISALFPSVSCHEIFLSFP
jgi:hypothetical protein